MNVSDDWSHWETVCPRGHRYHASDDGCTACGDEDEGAPDPVDVERRPMGRWSDAPVIDGAPVRSAGEWALNVSDEEVEEWRRSCDMDGRPGGGA